MLFDHWSADLRYLQLKPYFEGRTHTLNLFFNLLFTNIYEKCSIYELNFDMHIDTVNYML